MRVLVDPDTGELVEVLESDTVGVGAYDLPQGRRAVMAQTREKREALKAHQAAVQAKGDAEAWYRKCLAAAIMVAENEHGKTNAQALAKGTDEVAEAKEKLVVAEGLERNAVEHLRLCSEDRASIHRLIEWSKDQERFTGGGEG